MKEDFILPELDNNLLKEELFSSIRDFEKRTKDMPESERVPADTYACDCLFLKCFVTDAMHDDFPLIARDFLKHEFANVDKYEHINT